HLYPLRRHLLHHPHRPPPSPLFPYTTLFRSIGGGAGRYLPPPCWPSSCWPGRMECHRWPSPRPARRSRRPRPSCPWATAPSPVRSEEHTSELQSPYDLVCRLLLEKKKERRRR